MRKFTIFYNLLLESSLNEQKTITHFFFPYDFITIKEKIDDEKISSSEPYLFF